MRRSLLVVLTSVTLLALTAGQALAFDCYVENKPNGAGAVTEADLKPAGRSGKLVAPGAFLSTEVTGLENDIFVRGQPVGEEDIVGIGTLPEEPHCNGGDNGVQTIAPQKCP